MSRPARIVPVVSIAVFGAALDRSIAGTALPGVGAGAERGTAALGARS